MIIENHDTIDFLQEVWQSEQRAKVARRLRMMILARRGWTAKQIGQAVGSSQRSVRRWVARYNAMGRDGLETQPGQGRKPALNDEEQRRLKMRLDEGPQPEDRVCTLRGKDIQRILAEEFGKVRSLDAVYYILHQLGYEPLAPRSQHRWADPPAQDEFKKSFSNRLRRLVEYIPASELKSSSRTNVGSVSKAR